MKILFSASLRGKKHFNSQYQQIVQIIKELGHSPLGTDYLSSMGDKIYEDLKKGGRQSNVDFYKREMKLIQQADICIFECSTHSLSIGFSVQKTLEMNKPAIVLYYKDNVPFFLSGAEDDKLILKNYDESNVKDVIRKTIDEASELRDKRFNFFINPSLLTYLENTSKSLGVTKSNFIRNLILDHMKKNK